MEDWITFRRVSSEDETLVQSILVQAPGYFQRVEGVSEIPTHMARKEMEGKPKKQNPTYEKVFLVVYLRGKPIGVIDLHRDHPEQSDAYVGLFLLGEPHQSIGLGKLVYSALEKFAKNQLGTSRFVLGVGDSNDVSGFWTKMGFQFNGKTYIWQGENREVFVREMDKNISI